MEQAEQYEIQAEPSYWPSVGIAALIFGFIYFVISLIGGYATINAKPTGSVMGSLGSVGAIAIGCLIAAFGGMLAIWHYSKAYDIKMTLGKGALIGLYTGVGVAIVVTILNQVWLLIDPGYMQKIMHSTMENYKAMNNISDDQKQKIIDGLAAQSKNAHSLWNITKGFLLNAVPLGIVNLLTGLLGVKLFAKQEEL